MALDSNDPQLLYGQLQNMADAVRNGEPLEPSAFLEEPNMGLASAGEDTAPSGQHVQDGIEYAQQAHSNSNTAMGHQTPHLGPGEVLASAEQSAAADFGQLKVLDVREVADRFWSGLQPGALSYVHHLAAQAPLSKLANPQQGSRLPPNVQPSILQHKLCAGANRLSSCLLPTPTADGLSFINPPITSSSSQQQRDAANSNLSNSSSSRVWQFGFSLIKATHVGPSGFESQRTPIYSVARVCMFDRASNRFIGNVHTLPATDVRGKGSASGTTWFWDPSGSSKTLAGTDKPRPDPIPPGQLSGSPAAAAAAAAASGGLFEAAAAAAGTAGAASLGGGVAGAGGANACIVRCAQEGLDPVSGLRAVDGERLSLYIELNVAFKLTVEDAAVVPQAEVKGVGLVTELTSCWGLVSLKRCAELARELDISVPLYTGSIYTPGLLAAVWAAERKRHPLRSMFSAAPAPQLTFRAGPLPARPAPLLAYNLMPPTCIMRRDIGYLLAAARLALAQQLETSSSSSNGPTTAANTAATSITFAARGTGGTGAAAGPAAAAAGVSRLAVSGLSGLRPGVVSGFGDAALAVLPHLLDDELLLEELLAKWWGRARGLSGYGQGDCLSCACDTVSSLPSHVQLVSALRASLLEVAPLLHCSSLPPPHTSNFLEHQSHRAQVAARFLRVVPDPAAKTPGRQQRGAEARVCRHPVEVLSGSGFDFLHAPFDVAETRVCLADALGSSRWNRC